MNYASSDTKMALLAAGLTTDIDELAELPEFKQALNVAEGFKAYYESKDFAGNYADLLLEDRHACIQRIIDIIDREENVRITRNTAENIYEYILDNLEDFLDEFTNHWTGEYSVDSISYGEQEEQLTGIYELENVPQPIIAAAFESADYYVKNIEYAYCDLSSKGLCIKLKMGKIRHLITE
jgi:6-pyruvoyl-tetrahydropterin synthase